MDRSKTLVIFSGLIPAGFALLSGPRVAVVLPLFFSFTPFSSLSLYSIFFPSI